METMLNLTEKRWLFISKPYVIHVIEYELCQGNQAYLSEDVDKGSRIARGWSSHAMPWRVKRFVFYLSRGELN